jgi:elongation factor G
MGELHLEIIVDRLQREYSLNVNVGRPQVAYKESIKKETTMEGKYIKQTGGRGQYGHVILRVSPSKLKTFLFTNKIVGGSIPKEYIPAIKKGVQESLLYGSKGNFPIINIEITLLDGSFHDVDSSEMAFKIAASMALKKCIKNAEPFILEPIMKTEIITPDQYVGDILSDINSKRGKIMNIQDKHHIKILTCLVPLSNMFGFSNDLRSKTQGRASYTMEFESYKMVPSSIEEKIVNKI